MAFVYRSKRFQEKKIEYNVDPYINQKEYNEKENFNKNKIFLKPIKYNAQKNLKKINLINEKEKIFKQEIIDQEYRLKEQINKLNNYDKPNGIFKSKTAKNLSIGNNYDNPGPGNYEINSIFENKIKQINKEKQLKKNKTQNIIKKQISNPSIPIKRTDNIPIQNNDLKNYIKDNIDYKNKIGPGSYNISNKIGNSNFVKWKKPKKEKLQEKQIVGPGSYDPSLSTLPSYKDKNSSFFLDNVPKNLLPNEIIRNENYNTNMEFIKNSNPGPGYYYNPQFCSSIINEKIDKKFQHRNFGIKRFINKKYQDKIPDPGFYYNNKDDQLIKPSFNKKNNIYNSQLERKEFIDLNKKKFPGPGQYYNDKSKKIKKNKIPFNISSNKEKINIESEIPGPGQYFKQKYIRFEDQIKNETNNFKSNLKRDIFIDNKVPGPGTYNITNEKIIEENSNQKPFNIGEIRFQGSIIEEKEEYENKCEEILDKIFKGIPTFHINNNLKEFKQNKKPFNSNIKRFNDNHINNNLGPGDFNLEKEWNLKSYNKLFK